MHFIITSIRQDGKDVNNRLHSLIRFGNKSSQKCLIFQVLYVTPEDVAIESICLDIYTNW